AWLYDLLKPHVTEVLVCNPRKIPLLKQGNKSDKIDARKLAERLRLHDLKPVYHGETGIRRLRELARRYLTDRGQGALPDDGVLESPVSELGDFLCGQGRLVATAAQPVAGEDSRSWNPLASRATLSATGPAAALTPTSAARTAG